MEKSPDSGLTCFMIVMKFHGIPITKEQAEGLSVLDPEQKTGEIEIVESAKKLKMRARLCRLNITKLKNVNSPIIERIAKRILYNREIHRK
ncbi:MAG: cysteine peptidase family C39 domain-containing protein [Oscillospiraceae bacterium]